MEAAREIRFDLKEYSIIEKGKFLKNIYTWKLTEFHFDAYFLSIRNSYKVEASGTALESMITRVANILYLFLNKEAKTCFHRHSGFKPAHPINSYQCKLTKCQPQS